MAKKHVAVSLRKPPSPEKLDAFVAAAAEAPAAQPSSRRRRRAVVAGPELTAPEDTLSAPEAVSEVVSAPEAVSEVVSAPEAVSEVVTAPESGTVSAPAPEAVVAPAPEAAPGLRPVTVYLPQPLAERLALHCVANDRDASNVIGEALEQHLSRRLGAGSWSPGPSSSADAPPGARAEQAGPFRWEDPRRWADAFAGTRVERILQVGRVLYGLWQRRR